MLWWNSAVNRTTQRGILTDGLVNRVVVVKLDEGEAALALRVPVDDDVNVDDVTELREVVAEVFRLDLVLDSTHKDLLHRHVSLRPVRILRIHARRHNTQGCFSRTL